MIGLDDGTTGIQTARILAHRGVRVVAIANDPKHYCCRTNCCDEKIFADCNSDEVVALLEQVARRFDDKPVLFPCQDLNVLAISRNRARLSTHYRFVLPPAEVVELMTDKPAFYDFAERNDLPIPKTVILRRSDDIQGVLDQIPFPIIIKPALRTCNWNRNTRDKAFTADTLAELHLASSRCFDWVDVLVAQQLIPGDDANHYSCNIYVDRHGQIVRAFTARKLRQWPPGTGQGCLSVACEETAAEQLTRRLFQSLPFHGLAYVEFKRSADDNELYIIEPNIGRPTGRSAAADAVGVDLIYSMYLDAWEQPLPSVSAPRRAGTKWIHWRRDLQASFVKLRKGELTLRQWWQSIRGPRATAIFSWSDPVPFLADFWRVFVEIVTGRRSGIRREGNVSPTRRQFVGSKH